MSCPFRIIVPNKELYYFFFLLLPLLLTGQTANEKLQQGLDQFQVIENPRDGIDTLLRLDNIISETTDSLQGHYYLNLGIGYGQINRSDSSFYYLNKAENIAKSDEQKFLLAMIYNTRGLVYMGKAEHEESLIAFQEVMRLAEGAKDPKLQEVLSKTYGNLGGVYYQLGQIDKALEITKKSLILSETIKDTTEIALNHLRLAMVYNDLEDFENAISHLNTARTFFKNLDDSTMLVYAEKNLGDIFVKRKLLDKALIHYQQAHNYAKALGEQEEYVLTLIDLAGLKLERNNIEGAEEDAQIALSLSQEKGYANSEQDAFDLLYKIALKKGNVEQALVYRNEYIILSDSLNNVEVKARVAALETQYETAKKEKEIQKLTYESQISRANLKRTRNEFLFLMVGGILLFIVLLLFFITRFKKVKAEREAQALQVEALQKRFMELHSSPSELSVDLNIDELNDKLQAPLTDREFETLKLCIAGKTNTEIADQLFVSVSTVKFHLRNAYSKLGVNNRKEAFKFMLESI